MMNQLMRKVLTLPTKIAPMIACFLAFGFLDSGLAKAEDKRPNIVVIMADDMGFSDLGCTGSEIETPNLDAMAANGLLFTNFYNTSRCCPSRAALLTGQYQWDAGLGHMTSTRSKLPEYQRELSHDIPTIAELLGANGYQTMMSGKWHVGDERDEWPDKRGFHHFYGTPAGGGIYFYPSKFYKRPVYEDGEEVTPDENWYSTDGFTDGAVNFIRHQRDADSPFFLYVAYVAPHFPLQAKEEDIQKYRGKYDEGYSSIRKGRFDKQIKLGLFEDGQAISKPAHSNWKSVKNKEQASSKMAVYAAQVDCMDQNIGKLMDALRSENIADNTVVMFLSDNGAATAGWNKTPKAELGTRDCNAAYGAWYNVSNTPYREAKSRVHEGGIITPLVFHWPNGIRNSGRKVSRPAHIMDILPTCLEMANCTYPNEFNSKTVDPLDGESFLESITSAESASSRDRRLFWEHEGNQAMRHGDWKLVKLRKKEWELFDLSKDPVELNNLAQTKPDLVQRLSQEYEQWAEQHGVQPWPLKKK